MVHCEREVLLKVTNSYRLIFIEELFFKIVNERILSGWYINHTTFVIKLINAHTLFCPYCHSFKAMKKSIVQFFYRRYFLSAKCPQNEHCMFIHCIANKTLLAFSVPKNHRQITITAFISHLPLLCLCICA